jgi:hypothetical protein
MAKPSGHRKSPGPMHSKKQWAWAWATHQPFAKKWSDEVVATRGKKTGYHSLPNRKPMKKR